MLRNRIFLFAALLPLSACGSDSDPAGPDDGDSGLTPSLPAVASVRIESPVVMLWDKGLSTRLTGTALDSERQPIPDVEFTWTTADPEIALVTDGVVTATGDGWVEIRGEAGGHSAGVQIIVVTPDGPTDRLDCIACHAIEFIGQHGTTNTPQTCLVCHTERTWQEADFDHASVANGFELRGAHVSLSCTACHATSGDPIYPGAADEECVVCHQAEYDGRHAGSGYPTTCLSCHTTDGWSGADFDHASVANGFELRGAHVSLSCTACHAASGDPIYPGVADEECVVCHQAEYDGQHAGSGYPTTCRSCHTTETWSGAEFDHDAQYFPILAGKHQGKWSGCVTCHVDTSDYTVFSCFACHPHDQNRMDERHSEITGYLYDSISCYACHPDGDAN
jgi:hypothetical protein